MVKHPSYKELEREVEDLRVRLVEAEETLRAIRHGEIDGLVVGGPQGDQVFVLHGAERPYRILIEEMNEGAVTLSADGLILYCNGRFAEQMKMPADQILGKALNSLLTLGDQSVYKDLLSAGLAGRSCGEVTGQAADGSLVSLRLSFRRLPGDAGDQALSILVTDITERKKAEKKLEAANEVLETLFSTTHLKTAYLDSDFNFIRVNRAYAEADGRSPEFFTGKNHFQLYPHEENEMIFREVVETGEPYIVYAKPFIYPDNPERGVTYWDWSLYPVKDPRGKVEAVVLYLLDVTERIRAKEAEKKAAQQLEEQRTRAIFADRLRSLGQMAAGMAHELNQPLLGVRGLAEHILIALNRGWNMGEETVKEKIGLIIDQADRMIHVIEHARMFARGADDSEMIPVQMNDVIKSAIGMLGTQLKSRGIDLRCELAPDLPETRANPFSLEEVVLNLIANARDAIMEKMEKEKTEKPLSIILRTAKENEGDKVWVNIEVIDQGVGIPSDKIDEVFDPFFTTKGLDQGTGLGLSISRSIVERLNGKIGIQSLPDAGTTVSLHLPVYEKRGRVDVRSQ